MKIIGKILNYLGPSSPLGSATSGIICGMIFMVVFYVVVLCIYMLI